MSSPLRLTRKAELRRAHGWSTVALLVAFLPLAFSGDLIQFAFEREPGSIRQLVERFRDTTFLGVVNFWDVSLIIVDLVLYVAIGLCSWRAARAVHRGGHDSAAAQAAQSRERAGRVPRFTATQLFWASLVATVILDAGLLSNLRSNLIDSFIYLVPQIWIFLAIAYARGSKSRLRDSIDGVPLLSGTFVAWVVTSVAWSRLIGDTGDGTPTSPSPWINQEYFAQLSQLLPILLIALTVEFNYFREKRGGRDSFIRAVPVIAIVTIGELAVILALLRPADVGLDELGEWLEYTAFLLGINAVSVALAALLVAVFSLNSTANTKKKAPDMNQPGQSAGAVRDEYDRGTIAVTPQQEADQRAVSWGAVLGFFGSVLVVYGVIAARRLRGR